MYRKFIELLRLISEELIEKDGDLDKILTEVDQSNINLFSVNEELSNLEKSKVIDEDEADTLRTVLLYLFMREGEMEIEDIYALVFGNGKRLIWH